MSKFDVHGHMMKTVPFGDISAGYDAGCLSNESVKVVDATSSEGFLATLMIGKKGRSD